MPITGWLPAIKNRAIDELVVAQTENITSACSCPDIIAALDCGFKFYPSWDPCIPTLVDNSGAPLVFTEFTLPDTKDNLTKVEKLVENLDTVIPPR